MATEYFDLRHNGHKWSHNCQLAVPAIDPMNDRNGAFRRYGLIGRLRQARALAALAGVLAIALPWACLPRGAMRSALARLAWTVLLGGFGIRLNPLGAHPCPGALVVSNHVSWIDIAALAHQLDCGFVAKSEVAGWPVIGSLARRQGCLFIERERRGAVPSMLGRMRSYGPRRSLVLFPEGTSGEGDRVLPFRTSLFAAAGERFAQVQPVTLHFRRRDGAPIPADERRQVAWVGEDALLPHAMALAASGGVVLDLWFEEPLPAADRKQLAETCHARISARLAQLSGADQAAALKRAA